MVAVAATLPYAGSALYMRTVKGRRALVLGGILSAAAAVLHLAVIAGGASWYRFFGAGEAMAQAADAGAAWPALVTLALTCMLGVWSAYAFAGAGLLPHLPLLRAGLVTIAAVYLLRGLAVIPYWLVARDAVTRFDVVSSLVVLAPGLAYALGAWRRWQALAKR